MFLKLPTDIVNYIYTFDDNINNKRYYNQIICDLKVRNRAFVKNYEDCMIELIHFAGLYKIYKLSKKMNAKSVVWYILKSTQTRKKRIFVDNDLQILLLQRRYRELYSPDYFTNLYNNNISYKEFMKNYK